MIEYLKKYLEPNETDLRSMAMASAKKYFSDRPRSTVSIDEWQSYQSSYRRAYRHRYAITRK